MIKGSLAYIYDNTIDQEYNDGNFTCEYRQNSYFNTTVISGDEIIHSTDMNCDDLNCEIQFRDLSDVVASSSNITVLVEARNRFGVSTAPFSVNPSQFNFTVSCTDGTTVAECTVPQQSVVRNCTVTYATSSSFEESRNSIWPVNEMFSLQLELGTMYYLDAAFNFRSSSDVDGTIHLQRECTPNGT